MKKYTNSRGYSATVLAMNADRVVYNSYDSEGKVLQLNNCVSAKFFKDNWQ